MRHPSPQEREDIEAAFDAWTPGLLSTVEAETGCLLMVDGKEQPFDLHLATPGLADDVIALTWPTDHAGLPLGPLIHGRWRPSLAAAVLTARHADRMTARISGKTVQPFLYGRRLDASAVERTATAAAPGDYVFVADPAGRPLGIARLAPDGRGLEPVRDLGWYLREGG